MLDITAIKRWFGEASALGRETVQQPLALHAPALALRPAVGKPDTPAPNWPGARLELVEQLWGEGFVLPGGAAEVTQLVNPMGLSGADTLLLLGAGPFGAARTLATASNCWVDGYERDPELLALAQYRAEVAGLKKRAPTQLLEAAPKFRAKSASHALVMQALPDTDAIAPVLAGLAGAVRPGGQLGMVELVAEDDLNDPVGQRWLALEKRTTPPPVLAGIGAELRRLAFDVRIVEDISARHTQQVLAGWNLILAELAAKPTPQRARMMVAEAEPWLLRLKLIEAKRLRLLRWQAIRK